MNRYIKAKVLIDLERKMVLISGPRQSGKTTLSKSLYSQYDYFNYDDQDDRLKLFKKEWDREQPLLIFDEIHKKPKWKSWLKGVYDKEGNRPRIVVTGSARLDIVRKMGDSLAGRYFQYRLHPFDLKELRLTVPPKEAFHRILVTGGFPEPFLDGTETYYRRWRKTHLDIILRQDLLDLESVQNIHGIETLISLLRERVGTTVSYSSLARDLEKDPKTIKRWLTILENLYVIFKVAPYSKNLARAYLKEPKYYFYDVAQVKNGDGPKLENLIAHSLHKELDYLEDTEGLDCRLWFIRTKEKQEVDFLITIDEKPVLFIESKWSDESIHPFFSILNKKFPSVSKIQLVAELKRERTTESKIEVRNASDWLANMDLKKFV